MPKFRKKPVVIEAWCWGSKEQAPEWFDRAFLEGRIDVGDGDLRIKTLEGVLRADDGDWVIQGVKGEIYPCKPDIFEATYERVE